MQATARSRPPDVAAYAAALSAGSPVALTVRRGTRELVLRGAARELPRETHAGASVDYGSVPWGGGELRDILVMPEGVAAPPVVYLIQGYTCSTIENATYRQLTAELVRAGIGVYRVEKAGIGDSRGGPHCNVNDYAAELDGFRAAYRHLMNARGIPADRIFMLGHSLGGLQAPMLAAEEAPRGVAVYGTVLRNWADYHRDVSQFQAWLFGRGDLVEQTAEAETFRDVFRRFYLLRETPAAVAAADPAFDRGLREGMGWDGADHMFGRHYKYLQDLAHLPLIAAWRDTRSNVLAIHGESDFVAVDDRDHRLIAELANRYRPGTGRFVAIPRTGHGMDMIGSPAELLAQARAGGEAPAADFNPEIPRVVASWVRESMTRPAVRMQAAG